MEGDANRSGCRPPRLCNVKFHFSLTHDEVCQVVFILEGILQGNNPTDLEVSKKRNFYVVRPHDSRIVNLVFVIFPHGKRVVNVSGVRTVRHIPYCLRVFKSRMNLVRDTFAEEIADTYVVDNITAVGKLCLDPDTLFNLVSRRTLVTRDASSHRFQTCSCRPHYFPGIVLRSRALPTCIVFASGKYIIVGGKSIRDVKHAFQALCAVIQNQERATTSTPAIECVSTAGTFSTTT